MVLPWMLSAPAEQVPEVHPLPPEDRRPEPDGHRLVVASWNLAHGRGRSVHQVLRSEARMRRELDAIAGILRRERVDLAAFQEVDGRSWWNGGVDQTRHVAHAAGFSAVVRGDQVATWGLHYGTGIAACGHLANPRAVAFPPGAYAPGKGFTLARWSPDGRRAATVVSAHLHFVPGRRRHREAAMLVEWLEHAPRPLIVCGDFNAGWRRGAGIVARIAEHLDLQAWQPLERMPSLVGRRARIDWILASAPLRIVDYRHLAEVHSDHRAVIAELDWPVDEEGDRGPA